MRHKVTFSTGVVVEIAPVSKMTLQQAQASIPEPKIPQVWDDTRNRYIENPFSPDYEDALEETALLRSEAVIDTLIEHGITYVDGMPSEGRWIYRLQRSRVTGQFTDRYDLDNELHRKILYTKIVAANDSDYALLAQTACVTEESVDAIVNSFGMVRGGMPIDDYPLRFAIQTGISAGATRIGTATLTSAMDEFESCVGSGLDWNKWVHGVYDIEFMVYTVAISRALAKRNRHTDDARQIESEKRSKRKGK